MSIDFMELWEKTIQSQYGSSAHLKGIIEAFAKEINPTVDIETFYQNMYDPRTAEGFGLDVWGMIVGVDRLLEVDDGDYFGFFGSDLTPMDNEPFYYDQGATNVYRIEDDAFRELIFLKAFANISDATLPKIKYVINQLFDGSTAIMAGHMVIRVLFMTYKIPLFSLALLKRYGFMNLGAGVGWEYYIVNPRETFGFSGQNLQPFNNGIFAPTGIISI